MAISPGLPIPRERNLFFAQQVDQASINAISKSIIEINEDDEQLKKICEYHNMEYTPAPIKLYIDSYGGHVYQCLGLLGIMEKSLTPIHTIVTGCAMSCGFLISISGHKRYGYSGSTFLYHQVSSGIWGKAADIEAENVEVMRLQEIIENITLNNTSIKPEKLKKIYKQKIDWYMHSKEALKLGVIDEII